MDATTQKLMSLVDDLDDDLDDLEESLAPLLEPALVKTASKYPVLDRAKLYVLVTYAIESMLFCISHVPYSMRLTNSRYSVFATSWRQG